MKWFFVIGCLILFIGCSGPEPRRPVEVKSGTFFRESVERNKALLAQEESQIREIIQQDSLNQYLETDFGAWYSYDTQVSQDEPVAKGDDLLTIRYDLLTLQNDTIYTAEEIGNVSFRLDKKELFAGLRQGVKLLKKGESATFLFPSHLGYGYHGDNDRIGHNVPLKSRVTIINIEPSRDSIPN